MSSLTDTIQKVVDLAARLPGISVRGYEVHDSEARLFIVSSGREAIESIQYLAGTANVPVEPFFKQPAPDLAVEQTLLAQFRPRDSLKFGELQILGIHVVWRLHKLKLMTPAEANPILKLWCAVPVGG